MDFSSIFQRDLASVGKVVLAYGLMFPVGWYRERSEHSVGIRTFPIVAMASCGYVLMTSSMDSAAQSRVIQGMVAGMGFIGGGAILKSENHVHGVATAASIWNTGVVGASVALDHYFLAVALAVFNFLALRFLRPVKDRLDESER